MVDEKLAGGGDYNSQAKYGDLADDLIEDFNALSLNRKIFESHCQEVAELVWPEMRGMMQWGNSVTPGEKRTDRQVDSTAQQALNMFVAIVDSLMTPVDSLWHTLRNPDPDVMKSKAARLWYEQTTATLFDYRYLPQSGFIGQNQAVWQHVGAFGTGVLFSDEYKGPNGEPGLRYRNVPWQEAYIKENHQGIVDTLYRAYYMTPRQMKQRFGDALPEDIMRRAASPNASEGYAPAGGRIRVLHCVRPRADYDEDRIDDQGKYWESVYLAFDHKCILSTGGYRTFPYAVSRYGVIPNEFYGRGPAMAVLPTIKSLQLIKKSLLKAGHRAVDPILLTADDGLLDTVSLRPGAINKGGVTLDGKPMVHTLPIGNVQLGKELLEMDTAIVRDAFLVNLFQILTETPTMTATEVIERTREKATLLAPSLSRQVEYLGTLIDREIDLLSDQGLIAPPPREIREAKDHYRVVYTSPLARAKMAEEGSGTLRTIESLLNWVNVTQDRRPLYRVNWDECAKFMAQINAMPERLLHSDDEVQAQMDAEAKAAEQAHEVQAAPAAAALLKAKAVASKAGMPLNAMPRTPFAAPAA